MKFRAVDVVIWVAAAGAAAASAAGEPGEENRACESTSPGGDFVQFHCPVPASGSEQRWRFKAYFSGGHDDTSASMKATLNGAPFECAAGSKTQLYGEDGEVSLVCHARIPSSPVERPMFEVALLWSHAQYVRSEWVAE